MTGEVVHTHNLDHLDGFGGNELVVSEVVELNVGLGGMAEYGVLLRFAVADV